MIPEIDTAAEIDLILIQDGSKGPYLHWKEHIHGGAYGERSSLNLGLTTGCFTDLFGHGIVDTSAHGVYTYSTS